VVISPHCDDAALGCGELLAARPGSVVVTVFAGIPPRGTPLPPWDAASGFRSGGQAMRRRRAEDRAALACLAATPAWLPFLDAQYERPASTDDITEALAGAILGCRAAVAVLPLGLFHEDHHTVHAAALRLVRRLPGLSWWVYADALYRTIDGLVATRLASLRAGGWRPEPLPPASGHAATKRRAIQCYASQLRALAAARTDGVSDALTTEQYWRLTT